MFNLLICTLMLQEEPESIAVTPFVKNIRLTLHLIIIEIIINITGAAIVYMAVLRQNHLNLLVIIERQTFYNTLTR